MAVGEFGSHMEPINGRDFLLALGFKAGDRIEVLESGYRLHRGGQHPVGISQVVCRECKGPDKVVVSDPLSSSGYEDMVFHLRAHLTVEVGIEIAEDGKSATFGFGGN